MTDTRVDAFDALAGKIRSELAEVRAEQGALRARIRSFVLKTTRFAPGVMNLRIDCSRCRRRRGPLRGPGNCP